MTQASHNRVLLSLSLCFFSLLIGSLTGCAVSDQSMTSKTQQELRGVRTFGTVIEDKSIESKVLTVIRNQHPDLANSDIKVHAYNGIVLLVGNVPSKTLKNMAGKAAQNIRQTRIIHNQLATSEYYKNTIRQEKQIGGERLV